jgi:hypothetical protein
MSVRKGVLLTNGSIEYAPQMTQIMIKKIILDNFDGDYIHEAPIALTKKSLRKSPTGPALISCPQRFQLWLDNVHDVVPRPERTAQCEGFLCELVCRGELAARPWSIIAIRTQASMLCDHGTKFLSNFRQTHEASNMPMRFD